jgi:hypothetical protein
VKNLSVVSLSIAINDVSIQYVASLLVEDSESVEPFEEIVSSSVPLRSILDSHPTGYYTITKAKFNEHATEVTL